MPSVSNEWEYKVQPYLYAARTFQDVLNQKAEEEAKLVEELQAINHMPGTPRPTNKPKKSMAMQFKVGMKVIGRKGSPYTTTCEGWAGVVEVVNKTGTRLNVRGLDGMYFDDLESKYFEVVVEKAKEKKPKDVVVSFESVILEDEKKGQIKDALSQTENYHKIFKEWGFEDIFEKGTAISLLFYGAPGTGKTLMAQAIADEVKQPLLSVSTAQIESQVPGEAERNIMRYFMMARGKRGRPTGKTDANGEPELHKAEKCVLLFDECDSLIYDRGKVGMIIGAQINTLLSEIEKHDGIIILTTNRLGALDAAMERRITQKIEFGFPTEEMRVKIWERMIPKKCPLGPGVDLKELARVPIPGGNIKNAVLNAARSAARKKLKHVDLESFISAIDKEAGSINSFDGASKHGARVAKHSPNAGTVGELPIDDDIPTEDFSRTDSGTIERSIEVKPTRTTDLSAEPQAI